VVDRVPSRLQLAESIGAIPIDFGKGDPVEQIRDQTGGDGTDCGVDAVGYQGTGPSGQEQPAGVLNSLVEIVRATGRIGVVGLYVPHDPGAPDPHSRDGELLFRVGKFFEKGLRMGSGQANVKAYNQQLRDLIIAGRARPSFVVSKELPLDAAPDGYVRFDRREEGYSKVVLKPAA
jgi:glutathione-independent formaldehyde dehydrogenase